MGCDCSCRSHRKARKQCRERGILLVGGLALAADGITLAIVADAMRDFDSEAATSSAASSEGERDPPAIIDAQSSPYFAIGRITAAMVCTAAVVLDPQIVITAAHCVLDADDKLPRARPSFTPAYDPGKERRSYNGQVWTVGSWRQHTAQTTSDSAHDWAIVVLDEALVGINPLRIGSYEPGEPEQAVTQVLLPAYSYGVATRPTLHVDLSCAVREIAWDILLHDCEASSGSSGAPLLMRDGDAFAVIGINTGTIALSIDALAESARVRHSAVGAWSFLPALCAVHARLMRSEGVRCIPVC